MNPIAHRRLQDALMALRRSLDEMSIALPDRSGVRDHVDAMYDALEEIEDRYPEHRAP